MRSLIEAISRILGYLLACSTPGQRVRSAFFTGRSVEDNNPECESRNPKFGSQARIPAFSTGC